MGEVAQTMAAIRRAGKKALVPFVTAGFPTPDLFPDLLVKISELADVVEIGVPFSDPLADGPVIQETSQIALAHGVNLSWILETLADAKVRDPLSAPVVLMSYLNPLIRIMDEGVFEKARRAGVAGLILPDLPVEEGEEFEALAHTHEMDLIYLMAPTTGDERARLIAERSQGFIYLVSITGVTGTQGDFPPETFAFLERARKLTDKPLCIGFGISQPEQVRHIAPYVDGVIIGSSVLRVIMQNPASPLQAAEDFLGKIRQALEEYEQ
jgi:tryptophan synthase alpha chain